MLAVATSPFYSNIPQPTKQITSVYDLVWKSVVSLTLKAAVFSKPNTSWKALRCANSLCEKANTS